MIFGLSMLIDHKSIYFCWSSSHLGARASTDKHTETDTETQTGSPPSTKYKNHPHYAFPPCLEWKVLATIQTSKISDDNPSGPLQRREGGCRESTHQLTWIEQQTAIRTHVHQVAQLCEGTRTAADPRFSASQAPVEIWRRLQDRHLYWLKLVNAMWWLYVIFKCIHVLLSAMRLYGE